MTFSSALAVASFGIVSLAAAADWPQWRGPQRTSVINEPVRAQWPAEGPPILWRASVGTGFSSVSISQGRAYTMGNKNDEEIVWCLDALTGKQLWQHKYPSKLGPVYHEGGPVSTPTIEGNRVFTISKWGDVFCLDAQKGDLIWEHDFRRDGVISNRWGFAGSPLLWRDLVILNAGSFGSALDQKTGRVVWLNGKTPTGYASPTLYRVNGEDSILIFAAKHLVAVEPGNGHELWRFPWETGWDTNNPDPLVHHDQIFISSFSRGCALLTLKNRQPELVYDRKTFFNHLSPGVLIGDYLYGFSGEAKQKTELRCLHLPTGEVKWSRTDPPFGSLISAEGRLLILSEKGELLLADPSPDDLRLLARAQVLGGLCWTPPSLANGLVYVRNATGDVCCVDLRSKERAARSE